MEKVGRGLGGEGGQVRRKAALPGEQEAHQIGAIPLGHRVHKGIYIYSFNAVLPPANGDKFCRHALDAQVDRGH